MTTLLEKWENVLRVLEGLSQHEREKHWDMSTWGVQTPCGTVACAAGHCALDPWFQERGLMASWSPTGRMVMGDLTGFFDTSWSECDDWLCRNRSSWIGVRRDPRAPVAVRGAAIFHDPTPRSVETVIEEVKAIIQELRG